MSTGKKLLIAIVLSVLLLGAYVFPTITTDENDRTETLFVYGTLLNDVVRVYACRCLVSESTAILTGYEKMGLNIMPQEGSQVTGSLISVSPKELQRIDDYEDVPEKYQREQVRLSDQLVWVYVKSEEEE